MEKLPERGSFTLFVFMDTLLQHNDETPQRPLGQLSFTANERREKSAKVLASRLVTYFH